MFYTLFYGYYVFLNLKTIKEEFKIIYSSIHFCLLTSREQSALPPCTARGNISVP